MFSISIILKDSSGVPFIWYLKSKYEISPTNNANKQRIGIRLFFNKYGHPTKEQSPEKQVGTFAVIIIISTNKSHNDKKNNPIFLIILFIVLQLSLHSLTWVTMSLVIQLGYLLEMS